MLRRVAILLVAVASTMWICVFGQPVRVSAADPVGWRPLFSESFDDPGALPTICTAFDGAPEGAQAGYFRPEAVTVANGHLVLALQRRNYGGKQFVTGELRCLGAVQQYGRYQFSAQAPVGAGIESLALLRPMEGPAEHGSQLAIMAKPGAETADVSNGNGKGVTVSTLSGPFNGWHTYLIEWAPSGFRVLVDNQERLRDPAVSTAQRWFGFAVTAGDRAGQPGASTALPAEFRIDYLRIWAFDPVSSAPAAGASKSTVDNALHRRQPAGHRWTRWLAVAAAATAALALVTFVIRKTRPHRPPSSHRA
jgi:hypothetical protein